MQCILCLYIHRWFGYYICVGVLDEKGERGQQTSNGVVAGRRILAPTQVDNDPGDVAQECDGYCGRDEAEQGLDDAHLHDQVAALRTVADYVAESPDRLFAHVLIGRLEQAQEVLDRARHDHRLGLCGRAGRDIGQRPCRLELQLRLVVFGQAVDKHWQHVCLDDLIDRRILVARQQFSFVVVVFVEG